MFSILDASGSPTHLKGLLPTRGAACDQCKLRKVRCDQSKPCSNCSDKHFTCTYDRPRKKRGPTGRGRRVSEIQRLQSRAKPTGLDVELVESTSDGAAESLNDVEIASFPSSVDYQQAGEAIPEYYTLPDVTGMLSSDGLSYGHATGAVDFDTAMIDPNLDGFQFPSLPITSPDASYTFTGLEPHTPSIEAVDIWPAAISESSLLPWIDVYFKRLHPTIPILDRMTLYHDMLMQKHRTDKQYGSMLLAMCAFAMTQPVQIEESASVPSRAVQAKMMMEAAVKIRVTADFGEDPTIETILTSFFLFACLFGNSQHKAAWHKLREAVDMGRSLGLANPAAYEALPSEKSMQWLRTYLVLSVTERAYALQRQHSIGFRGRPGMTARFMQNFDRIAATQHLSGLMYQNKSDTEGMTGLLYLMESFDAVDESVVDCWNGYCQMSDGRCTSFDRRRAVQMFHAQRHARDSSVMASSVFTPDAMPLSLQQLGESQRADISITQFWLLNRLWNLCFGHGLLRHNSDNVELQYSYALNIAMDAVVEIRSLNMTSLEVHGVGMVEKVYDIATGLVTVMTTPTLFDPSTMDMPLESTESQTSAAAGPQSLSVRQVITGLSDFFSKFRGGMHPFSQKFASDNQSILEYPTPK